METHTYLLIYLAACALFSSGFVVGCIFAHSRLCEPKYEIPIEKMYSEPKKDQQNEW